MGWGLLQGMGQALQDTSKLYQQQMVMENASKKADRAYELDLKKLAIMRQQHIEDIDLKKTQIADEKAASDKKLGLEEKKFGLLQKDANKPIEYMNDKGASVWVAPGDPVPEGYSSVDAFKANTGRTSANASMMNAKTNQGKVGRPDIDPNSSKYRKGRLDHTQKAEAAYRKEVEGLDIDPQELENRKTMAGVEYDAEMQGWEKVTDQSTGEKGYRKPDGKIVDLFGVVFDDGKEPPPPGPNPNPAPDPKTQPVTEKGTPLPLPSIGNNGLLKSSINSMMDQYGVNSSPDVRKVIQATKGNYNQTDNTVSFKPSSEDDLKRIFTDLNKSGVTFDAKRQNDGTVVVSVLEKTPNMVTGKK